MSNTEQGRQKVQQQKNSRRNGTCNRQKWHQKQYSNNLQELHGHFRNENEVWSAQLENTTERKTASEVSLKESRKQSFSNISTKFHNNRNLLQNKNNKIILHSEVGNKSIIQNRRTGKSTEFTNQQNVKLDDANKITHAYNLNNNHCYMTEDIKDTNTTGMKNDCQSNVQAERHISYDRVHSYEGIPFDNFELIELLYYNVDLMQHEQLFSYAFALRKRILEKLFEFKDPVKKELEFLCAITDGSQTDRNQKLIARRMYFIVSNAIEETYVEPQLSYTCCNHETQAFQQTQNSDLIRRTNELYRQFEHAENVKQTIVDENSYCTECDKDTEENISNIDNCNSDELDSLPSSSWAARCDADSNLENNGESNNTTELTPEKQTSMSEDTTYSSFRLEDLLKYDVNLMQGTSLYGYAFALRKRISENISYFQSDISEKLKFLCELTDGTQTDMNQKLIINRMFHLINGFLNSFVADRKGKKGREKNKSCFYKKNNHYMHR